MRCLRQAREDARLAVERVDREIKQTSNAVERRWGAMRAKISADMEALSADLADRMHEHDVKRADAQAERLTWEAGLAIDYAIASVEQAQLAVLDAIDARVAAEEVART